MTVQSIAAFALIATGGFALPLYVLGGQNTPAPQRQEHVAPSPSPIAAVTPARALLPQEQFVAAMGLYLLVPEGMTLRTESADEAGRPLITAFYLEQTTAGELSYQLYGLYQADSRVSATGLAQAQTDMDPATIAEVTVGGYPGVEGLVIGPKGRYLTLINKDGTLLSFATSPPTEANKLLTDQILATISFQ